MGPRHTEADHRLVAQEVVADKASAVGEVARDTEVDTDAGPTSEVVADASTSRSVVLSIIAEDAGADAAGDGSVAEGKTQAEEAGGIRGGRSGSESGKARAKEQGFHCSCPSRFVSIHLTQITARDQPERKAVWRNCKETS